MFNLESISDKEDKVLIKDAIELCKQNQCRAAFIIGWLACAESLRRRIKFLGKTSNNAKKYSNISNQKKIQSIRLTHC